MITENYRVVCWHEDLWEESVFSDRAQAAHDNINICMRNGFKPLGNITPVYYAEPEGMRVYFTQVFYKEPDTKKSKVKK